MGVRWACSPPAVARIAFVVPLDVERLCCGRAIAARSVQEQWRARQQEAPLVQ